jgi:hypothetical protein
VIVRRYFSIFLALILCLAASARAAESFRLANGETLTGELLTASANDAGVQIKVGDGKYERVPWANFSQEDLKKFVQIQKLQPLVEPFIEITQADKIKRTEVPVRQPDRLDRQPSRSAIGALFSSGAGLFMLILLYAANVYAAYEIALYRARPLGLVMGVAAVAPVVGPIVFLSMPTRITAAVEEPVVTEGHAPGAAAAASTADVNPMLGEGVAHPAGLKLHHEEAAAGPEHSYPAPITFQRGQFTFNRRFFETKFPGFFRLVLSDAEKDLVIVIRTPKNEFVGKRISRISMNELHLVLPNNTSETSITFSEITTVILKHKDAKS